MPDKGRQDIRYIPIGITILALALLFLVSATAPSVSKVSWEDVVGEGIVAAIVLIWIIIIQKISPDRAVYLPLIVGLSLFFLGAFEDVLDEFYEVRFYYTLLEDVGIPLGMALATIGLYRWVSIKVKREREMEEYSRKLEHSSKLKDLFTDIMRHDLLNPAGVIRGIAEILLDEAPDKKDFQIIKRNIDKLINMIENASKLSRLESVEELEKKDLDLRTVVNNAIEGCRHYFELGDMEVDNRVKENMRIKANPVIEDIFLNLLSNAAKYASEGKKVIINAVDEGNAYRISVEDYGPGIPDDHKESIFTRFQRRKKAGVKGSGLGLAITKRIVELHNGKIWVEDNKPKGSVFYILLPKGY